VNVLKSEIKQAAAHEIGVRVEDALEAARKEVASMEGRQSAFLDAASLVDDTIKAVQRDIDAGTVALDAGTLLVGRLKRLAEAVRHQSVKATTLRNMAAGKVQGLENTVKLISNIVESEKARLEAAKRQAADTVSPGAVSPGDGQTAGAPAQAQAQAQVHRFVSIKEQRLAEQADAEAADGAAQRTPSSSVTPQPIQAKRRGRKPRATNS
jgi:hypothetical protein